MSKVDVYVTYRKSSSKRCFLADKSSKRQTHCERHHARNTCRQSGTFHSTHNIHHK